MKQKFISFCVALVFFFSSCSVQGKNVSMESQFRKVVQVYTFGMKDEKVTIAMLASAVPISKDYFLTAGHFCEAVSQKFIDGELDNPNVYVDYLGNGDQLETIKDVQIVDFVYSKTNDICLLKKENHNLKKVKLSRTYHYLEFGNKVYAVGYPLGFFPAIITEGFISSIYTDRFPENTPFNEKLMISTPIATGNSGGAIFNANGELIGIAVMVSPQYNHLSFAIPLPIIMDYLDSFKLNE
jgi:S1-C subfamily serine protease